MTRHLVNPKKLIPTLRTLLKAECGGDWERVTSDGRGGYTVHNNAARARQYVDEVPVETIKLGIGSVLARPSQVEKPKKLAADNATLSADEQAADKVIEDAKASLPAKTRVPAKKTAAKRAPRRTTGQPAKALTHLLGSEAQQEPAGVHVVPAVYTPEEAKARSAVHNMIWRRLEGTPDWGKVSVERSVGELHDACRNGLPGPIAYGYLPEVEELQGIDPELMDAALRNPQRVEIRPETKVKRYPVLAFHRGDMMVVLGMQIPTAPKVIACYVDSLLESDTYRRPAPGHGTGGGGSRRSQGLPSSLRASLKTLRMLGCLIPEEKEWGDAKTVDVEFRGQNLGRITVDKPAKSLLQSDYQRILRKVQAIRLREEKVPATV